MKLVSMPENHLQNIPLVLRSIADCIEDGDYGEIKVGGVIIETVTGKIELFGAGRSCDHYRMLALLTLAEDKMIRQHRGEE